MRYRGPSARATAVEHIVTVPYIVIQVSFVGSQPRCCVRRLTRSKTLKSGRAVLALLPTPNAPQSTPTYEETFYTKQRSTLRLALYIDEHNQRVSLHRARQIRDFAEFED